MTVDLATLYLLVIGTLLASSAMTYWEHISHPKRSKELRMLAAGYAVLGLGCALAAFRRELLGTSGAAVSNLVILGGYLLVVHAVAMFNSRRHLRSSIGLLLLMGLTWAAAGARWQTVVWLYVSAIPIALASTMTAFELMRRDGVPAVQSRRVAVAVTGIHALFYAARAFVLPWLVSIFGTQALSISSKITMYEGVIYSVILPMTLLRLTREEVHSELLQESRTDYLTRLGNRRLFFEEGERILNDCALRRLPVTLLAFDLDHFKKINDRYGHKTGDDVLRSFAEVTRASIETNAILARIGGEEFAALLPDYDSHRAKELGEIIASRFATMSHIADGHRIRATVSIGLATSSPEMTSLTDLLAAADHALYRAKSQGGDQAALAGAAQRSG
ncbi:GGDEF domain-containing protein [Burkholderia multivorans]|uniref:GGDEF domain-containing protein n=1 Tax=Burkholderia multivorans TaxID=87883 RepID=UPI0019954C35|nr:GGDEF domain-containing protein [Burkholderia multivorans]MBU9333403.1 GGDEF domain-containing protein [Burkholderia multivorans]MBU9669154.1 GGDEF domain-containing protein [Burkholderia multivorans]CAB5340307.1 diguanylate cyclase [Burkholderia multivorans]HEF4757460.1 GGDEF domain-containing protein [Burkholderia multivorans]